MKRLSALLLCAALLLAMIPAPASCAGGNVCFLAVNDSIPGTLEDATMPFYANGQLYVPSSIYYTPALGVTPAYLAASQTLTLTGSGTSVTFSLADGSVLSGDTAVSAPSAILQYGTVFVPMNFCAQAFSHTVSYLVSQNGYAVVRITTGAEYYSNSLFIQKAENLMTSRVQQYLSAAEAPAEPEPEKPATQPSRPDSAGTGSTPSAPSAQPSAPAPSKPPASTKPTVPVQKPVPSEPEQPEEPEEEPLKPVALYPALTGLSGAAQAQAVLSEFSLSGTFFLTAEEIAANPDAVLALYGSGAVIGVRAADGAEDIPASIDAANAALDRVLQTRTVFALVPDGTALPSDYVCLSAAPLSMEDPTAYAGTTELLLCDSAAFSAALAAFTASEVPYTLHALRETTLPRLS